MINIAVPSSIKEFPEQIKNVCSSICEWTTITSIFHRHAYTLLYPIHPWMPMAFIEIANENKAAQHNKNSAEFF